MIPQPHRLRPQVRRVAGEELAGELVQRHPTATESVVSTTEPTVGITQFARHIYTVVASKPGISSGGPL